jgi:hypothetical protein
MLFVLQERRAPQPMLPLSLFKHRLFALTSLVGVLVNVAFYRCSELSPAPATGKSGRSSRSLAAALACWCHH